MTANGKRTSGYRSWESMKQRCLNPAASGFKNYGGRGISVCDRWLSFENFLADMGPPPSPSHSIERKDNDGDYEPKNCRWATKKEQSRNYSQNVVIKRDGVSLCVTDWAIKFDLNPVLVFQRIRRGWSFDDALSTPPRSYRLKA